MLLAVFFLQFSKNAVLAGEGACDLVAERVCLAWAAVSDRTGADDLAFRRAARQSPETTGLPRCS